MADDGDHAPDSTPAAPRRGPGRLLAAVVGLAIGLGLWATVLGPDAGPEPVQYVVARGDTLWKIARAHGVEVDEIEAWNGLASDRIEVGQVLLIYPPGQDGVAEAQPTPTRRSRGRRSGGGGRVVATPEAGTSQAALRMPEARPCLAGPDEAALGDDGPAFAASAGLSYAQTKAAMDAFLPTLGRCVADGGADGRLALELTVACSGQVAEVRVVDGGGLPADLVSCVTDTLSYAAFPAHDMPDGFTFSYPMSFEAAGPE